LLGTKRLICWLLVDDATEYYCYYAKMVVFDLWKGRKNPQVQWFFFCNKQGYNGTNTVDKQNEKGYMRIGCEGHVKVKLDPKEGCWFFDVIDLKLNHELHPEKRTAHFMCAHKSIEDGVKNWMDVMTRAGVQHQAQMNVMLELYGGRDNWTFVERDMRNRFDQSYVENFVTLIKFYCLCIRISLYM
jgi:hypothetical protein